MKRRKYLNALTIGATGLAVAVLVALIVNRHWSRKAPSQPPPNHSILNDAQEAAVDRHSEVLPESTNEGSVILDPNAPSNRELFHTERTVTLYSREAEGAPVPETQIRFVSAIEIDMMEFRREDLPLIDPLEFLDRRSRHSVTTNESGMAVVQLQEGRWLAVAHAQNRYPEHKWLDIPAIRSVEFVMESAVVIDGLVIDGISRAPISGAVVVAIPMAAGDESKTPGPTLARLARGKRVVSDIDGVFRIDDVANERLDVHVSAAGYPSAHIFVYPADRRLIVELQGTSVVSGVVVDENGAPVELVDIEVWLRGKIPAQLACKSITDPIGAFRLESVPDGDVSIAAKKRGFGLSKVYAVLSPTAESYFEIELGPEAPLNGIVVDELGRPIEGAVVHVYDRDLNAEVGLMSTESDGTWYMLWLVPGHVTDVFIEKDGYYYEEFNNVELRERPHTFRLRRLGVLRGRVVDSDRRPVSRFVLWTDASLRTQDEDQVRAIESPWTMVEHPNGEFDFSTLLPCDYQLHFVADGFLEEIVDYPVSLGKAGNPKPIEVVLRRGHPISGRVVDIAGHPIPGVAVGIARAAGSGRLLPCDGASKVTTDASGSFSIAAAPTGAFDLALTGSEDETIVATDFTAADFPRDLVLAASGSISGRVISPWRDPTSCLEVRIQLVGTWIGKSIAVGLEGRFESGPLAPADYELTVIDHWGRSEADGEYLYSRVVTVISGETSEIEFETSLKATLRGIVHDRGGSLVPNSLTLSVSRSDSPDRVIAVANLLADGRFVVPGLDAGRHIATLVMNRPGTLCHQQKDVEIGPPGSSTEIEFDLTEPQLTGAVLDRSGAPVAAVVTVVDAVRGKLLGSVRCDYEGQYRVLDAEPVECIVWVSAKGFAEDHESRLAPGPRIDEEPLRHVLDIESRIEVSVVDDRRIAVASALVTLDVRGRPAALPPLACKTDASGSARFGELRQGMGVLNVRHAGYVAPAPIGVVLDGGSTRRILVVLDRLASLEVRLTDATGNPLGEKVPVTLVSTDQEPSEPVLVHTDSHGIARFFNVQPGSKSLSVNSRPQTNIVLRPGERKTLEWTPQ